MLEWLYNLISSFVTFILSLFGYNQSKKVRFEDEISNEEDSSSTNQVQSKELTKSDEVA